MEYERVRLICSQQWVFGRNDIQTKEYFTVGVEKCNSRTLIPIVQQYILPGERPIF